MKFEEKTVSSETVYEGKILDLKRDKVLLPDGKQATREVIAHRGASAVLCIEDGKVFLVTQFRYPFKEEVIEIPAGKIDAGETPLETAKRELKEEAGLIARRMEKIAETYPTPGYSDEVIHIFRAFDTEKTDTHFDEDEFLSGEWVELSEVNKMIETGKIKDAKTLVALLYALKR